MPAENIPEVARVAADLIRFDTSNFGGGRAEGEKDAADYVANRLTDMGLDVATFEPAPRRTSISARVPGRDRSRPALVVHGHLDVVPAIAADWSVDPFAGEIRDGLLWGRGAVDMKGMDAMILCALADLHAAGVRPERDLVVTFFADEEAGGEYGSEAVVRQRPEWFDGASEAISEVGGYSIDVAGKRAYLLQVGEKALMWLRLTATGRAGHGSAVHDDNAVTRLARAVATIGETPWPVELRATTTALLEAFRDLAGSTLTDPDDIARLAGPAQGFIRSGLRTTTNPTGLTAGYKHNVIPDHAEATIDVRVLPGTEDDVLRTIRELVGPDITVEIDVQAIGLEYPFAGDLVDAMTGALHRHDPGVPVIPYLLGGGTDNKALATLGITGYGFAPLRLPAGMDFTGMFHGVDERVPVESLVFGQRVLADLFRSC